MIFLFIILYFLKMFIKIYIIVFEYLIILFLCDGYIRIFYKDIVVVVSVVFYFFEINFCDG